MTNSVMKPQVECRVCHQYSLFRDIYTVVSFSDHFISELKRDENWICGDCYNWFLNMKSNVWELQNAIKMRDSQIKTIRKKLREARK